MPRSPPRPAGRRTADSASACRSISLRRQSARRGERRNGASAAGGNRIPPERRQLDYANGSFRPQTLRSRRSGIRKISRPLSRRARSGRAPIFPRRMLSSAESSPAGARKAFQRVLDDYGDSEFAGPAAYVLGEIAVYRKELRAALPLFHRGREIERAGGGAFRALFRSALSRNARSQRRSAGYLSAGRSKRRIRIRIAKTARLAAAAIVYRARRKSRRAEAIRSAFERNAEAGAEGRSDRARRDGRARSGADRQRQDRQGDGGKSDGAFAKRARFPKPANGAASPRLDSAGCNIKPGQYAQVLAEYKKELQQACRKKCGRK